MEETIKIYTADVALNPHISTDTKPYLICYSETKGYLFINKNLFSISFESFENNSSIFNNDLPIEQLTEIYDLIIENVKEFKEW